MLLVQSLLLWVLLACIKETQTQCEWANYPTLMFHLKTYSLLWYKQAACWSPGLSFPSLPFPTLTQVSISPTFKHYYCYIRLLIPSSSLLSAYSVFSFKWGHGNGSDLSKKKTNFSTSQNMIFWGHSTI